MSDALITRHQFHAPRETTDPGEEVNKSHIAPLKRNIILGSLETVRYILRLARLVLFPVYEL